MGGGYGHTSKPRRVKRSVDFVENPIVPPQVWVIWSILRKLAPHFQHIERTPISYPPFLICLTSLTAFSILSLSLDIQCKIIITLPTMAPVTIISWSYLASQRKPFNVAQTDVMCPSNTKTPRTCQLSCWEPGVKSPGGQDKTDKVNQSTKHNTCVCSLFHRSKRETVSESPQTRVNRTIQQTDPRRPIWTSRSRFSPSSSGLARRRGVLSRTRQQ